MMATDRRAPLARRRLNRSEADASAKVHQQLFRPEALQRRFEVVQPRAVSLMPVSWTILTGLLAVFAGIALTFLLTGNFARKESVTGILKPLSGEVVLRIDRAGVSSNVLVAEGQSVQGGQALYDIQTRTALLDGRMQSDELRNVLQLQSLNSEREAEARRSEAVAELIKVQEEERSGKRLIESLAQQHTVAKERYRLAREAVARMTGLLEKGYTTRQEADRRKDLELAAQMEVAKLATEQERALNAQLSFAPEIDRLRARVKVEEARASLALGQITERQLSSMQGQGVRAIAPVSGTVSGLRLGPGQPVQPGDIALSIIPADVLLIAELYVPSQAIGFMAAGQSVRLRYQAYPFQKFGFGTGRVLSVSQGAQKISDGLKLTNPDDPHYIVKVALDRQSLAAFGTKHPLRPGMMLSADIVLEARSLIEWLFEPVLSSSGRLT